MYANATQPGEFPGQGNDDDRAPVAGIARATALLRFLGRGQLGCAWGSFLKGRGRARRLPLRSSGWPLMATTPAGSRRTGRGETVAAAAAVSTRGRRRRAGGVARQAPSVSGRERTCLRAVERAELGHGEENEKGRVGLLVCWAERKKKKGFSYSNLFNLTLNKVKFK